MKMWNICVIFSVLWHLALSLTTEQLAKVLFYQTDKVKEPVTKDMCEDRPYFKYLRICRYMDKYKDTIRRISDEVFTYDVNYWKRVESEDTVTNTAAEKLTQDLNQLMYGSTSGRRKRSENQNQEKAHKIVKRGIPGNPCHQDIAQRAVLLFAVDPDSGTPLELFHDPDDKLYNTIYAHTCIPWQSGNLRCEVQYLEMRLPVFIPHVPWPHVVVKPVLIPSSCAINIR